MRRQPIVLLVVLLGFVVALAAESAPTPTPEPVSTGATLPLQRVAVTLDPIHIDVETPPANDHCADPATLVIPLGEVAAAATLVNSMDSDGPDLSSCLWNSPPPGTPVYRTVWYKLIPQISGRLVVEAVPNVDYQDDYDTVIAIHDSSIPQSPCSNLHLLACNDDAQAFLSRASLFVEQGHTYYIEVAAAQLAQNGIGQLNLQAYIDADNRWEQRDEWLAATPRSRHAVVAVGDDLYVIGGQTYVGNTNPFDPTIDPPVRTANLSRFNTVSRVWTTLAPMPPQCGIDGYSNTGAAYVNGFVYLPSGYVGDETLYADVHCVYNVAANTWSYSIGNDSSSPAKAPWPGGFAFGYGGVVADPARNGYFVVGGLTGEWFHPPAEAQAHNETYFYSPLTNAWRTLPSFSVARYSHTAALAGQCPDPNNPGALISDCVCVVGGLEPHTPTFPNDAPARLIVGGECYDRVDSLWGPIGSLNIPRFHAGSAVGPDGSWYVFGGLDAGFNAVAEVERFDPVNNRWQIVDRRFDLFEPVRTWPRGAFVGNNLWVVGGETSLFAGSQALNLVGRVVFPPRTPAAYLPAAFTRTLNNEPNNAFGQALRLIMWSSLSGDFNALDDRFDVYYFDIVSPLDVRVNLSQIPSGDNYDFYVYDRYKVLRGSGNLGLGNQDEQVTMPLGFGRYYIIVVAQNNDPLSFGSYRIYAGN